MPRYENRSGTSGVTFYELGPDSITVTFSGDSAYLYDHASTGRGNVERMKELAEAGRGLNTFINTNVRKKYARKLR